jgi:hypothetical protein
MNKKKKRILILFHNPDSLERTRITIIHHLRALEYIDGHNDIHYQNVDDIYQDFMRRGQRAGCSRPKISQTWDAIILHYSFLSLRTIGWSFRELKKDFEWVGDLEGLKIAIPQDEGDYAGLLDEWLLELGTRVIFSVHFTQDGPLYPIMRQYATIYPCLPGYIDEKTAEEYDRKMKPIAERKKDIVYRARQLPPWYGRAGRIKYRIAEVVKPKATKKGYEVDISISPDDTIPGHLWLDFMASGKTVLGTQGGYSTIDWRGEIKAKMKHITEQNPNIDFYQAYEQMPVGWDDQEFFTITPRHFEAIISNTCQILIAGCYKGILIPDYHYIPIKSDWSDLDEALDRIHDTHELQRIADQARKDILYSGKFSYKVFANTLERAMEDHQYPKTKPASPLFEGTPEDRLINAIERQFIAQRDEFSALEYRIQEIIKENIFENGVENIVRKAFEKYKPLIRKWMLGIIATTLGAMLLIFGISILI